jgi:Na+/glutamate symporter
MIHKTGGDMTAVVVIVLIFGSYVRNKLQIWQILKVPYTVKY